MQASMRPEQPAPHGAEPHFSWTDLAAWGIYSGAGVCAGLAEGGMYATREAVKFFTPAIFRW